MMTIQEAELTEAVIEQLAVLSQAWEKEGSCHGYRKNTPDDIRGNRVFLATDGGAVAGYLFGHCETAKETTSIYPAGTVYFELEELYVRPDLRNRGLGKQLFQYAEKEVADQAEMILLSTATKNFRAILHFYIDELGMDFWSARLFKEIR